jgi:hypothetical protein
MLLQSTLQEISVYPTPHFETKKFAAALEHPGVVSVRDTATTLPELSIHI